MVLKRLGLAGLAMGFVAALSGCADGYGYGGTSLGYGRGYYDAYPYGGGFGGGYVPSYYGWYNDFYYPGTGIYVYDRDRRPFRWNDRQRNYWQGQRRGFRNDAIRDNWADFGRDVRRERRDYRGDLRKNRQAYRNGLITRDQFQQGRRDARREYRSDVRQDRRELRRENRAVNRGGYRGDRGRNWRGRR